MMALLLLVVGVTVLFCAYNVLASLVACGMIINKVMQATDAGDTIRVEALQVVGREEFAKLMGNIGKTLLAFIAMLFVMGNL